MIRYLLHTQLDKHKWNQTIDNSYNGLVYAYSWYLDSVCPNWEALVLNDYQAVMPLTAKQKFGIHYLYNPFFVQQLGVFSTTEITEKLVKEFIDTIPIKYRFIEINLNSQNAFGSIKKGISTNKNYELILSKDYENIKKNYSENTKRNLKKASLNELKITTYVSVTSVVELFKTDRGATIKNLKEPHYQLFERLVSEAEKNSEVLKLGVLNSQEKLIAGAILFKTKSKITFLFSGNSDEGKQSFAMFFLIDFVIKSNSNQAIILDFEGSNNAGLAQFYKGFGSSNTPYASLKINRLPKAIKWLKK